MKTAKGYSIWLMPAKPEFDLLQRTISELGLQFQSPSFDPHLTLLGSVEGTEKNMRKCVQTLADEFASFKLKLCGYEMLDTFFMSLFLPTDLPSVLSQCHHRAKELSQWTLPPNYYPHLSLIYAELSKEEKLGIVKKLGPELGSLELTIDRIQLYCTAGAVADWCRIEDLKLSMNL